MTENNVPHCPYCGEELVAGIIGHGECPVFWVEKDYSPPLFNTDYKGSEHCIPLSSGGKGPIRLASPKYASYLCRRCRIIITALDSDG